MSVPYAYATSHTAAEACTHSGWLQGVARVSACSSYSDRALDDRSSVKLQMVTCYYHRRAESQTRMMQATAVATPELSQESH